VLLLVSNTNWLIVSYIITVVASMAIYLLLFRNIYLLVGYKIAVGLFLPFILVIGFCAIFILFLKFAKIMVVDEKNEVPK
jgi:hypothetical protein